MLAASRPTRRNPGTRSGARRDSLPRIALRRVGAFVLAHPKSVALMLLFGGLGTAVSVNALWLQSDRHPAPLFRQAALQPQHSIQAAPKKTSEPLAIAPASQPSAAAAPSVSMPSAEDAPPVLPPSRPARIGHLLEPAPPAPAKPLPGRHSEKDPLADLLDGTAPVPPAPIKSTAAKPQAIDKASHAATPSNDAIAALIAETARSR
jgi:hypothetical protein